MKSMLCVAVVSAGFAGAALGQSETVYRTNFGGSRLDPEWSGAGSLEHVGGFSGVGHPGNSFGGHFLRNDSSYFSTTVLTLTDLPPHSSVSIGFLLAIIDSWEGYEDYGYIWDSFGVGVDGHIVFDQIFAVSEGYSHYEPVDGGLLYDGPTLGWNQAWGEQAFDMSLEPALRNIPHTSSTLVITFTAWGEEWDGGLDESWGIDNVEVVVSDVCRADFNGDGFVTGQDFDEFAEAFEAGDSTADYDGDGFVTGPDFDGFVFAFEIGC